MPGRYPDKFRKAAASLISRSLKDPHGKRISTIDEFVVELEKMGKLLK